MKATFLPAAILLAALSACPAHAEVIWCAPALQRPLGYAPNTYGPGFYWQDAFGHFYGPSYCLRPPFGPESGINPFLGTKGSHVAAYGGSYPGSQGYPGSGGYANGPHGGQGPASGYPNQPYGPGPNAYGNKLYPGMPGMPQTPGMPGMPYMPGIGGYPPVGSYPGMPGYPGAGGYPGMPNLAGLPTLPTLPNMPALPNPPTQQTGTPPPTFFAHPFARGPRDYFMFNEVVEDEVNRYQLPLMVP